jgi:hypothetical protein
MILPKRLLPAVLALLLGAAPLRATPIVSINLPAGPVFVGDSFTLTVRAVGPIETLSLLLDLPATLVAPPASFTLASFENPSDPPTETEVLPLGGISAFGFHFEALSGDYDTLLPGHPAGTGRLLGIVPLPPLEDEAAEVTFTSGFDATAPGLALFRLGFLATLTGSPGKEIFGFTEASLDILRTTTPPVEEPVGVPAPTALALLLAGIAGLAAARRSTP